MCDADAPEMAQFIIKMLIQFGAFMNIDMYQKGSYSITCRVYQKNRQLGNLNHKRIEGRIIKIYGAEEKILKQIPEWKEAIPNTKDIEPFGLNHLKCTLDHQMCNWRCKVKKYASEFVTKIATPFIYIESQGQIENLLSGALFEIPISFDNTQNLLQENCIYLEFELFFKDTIEPEQVIFEQRSCQRKIMKVLYGRDMVFQKAVYHQLEFDQIFCSSIDIVVSAFLCEVSIKKSKESLKTRSINEMKRTWSRFVSSASMDLITDNNDLEVQNVISFQEIFKILLKNLYLINLDISNHFSENQVPMPSVWVQLSNQYGFISHYQTFSKSKSAIERKTDLDKIENDTFGLKSEIVWEEIFKTFNQLLSDLCDEWLKIFSYKAYKNLDRFRVDFRTTKSSRICKYIIEKDMNSFLDSTNPEGGVNLDILKMYTENAIEDWPRHTPKVLLVQILESMSSKTDDIQPAKGSSGSHLIVFVHGLLGNESDLRIYRNKLVHYLTDLGISTYCLSFLISKSNLDTTFMHISTLGNNLANEIVDHINTENVTVDKISFVCHSLGGIIARLAIRHEKLSSFKSKFHSFTSFASPHLSLVLHSSSLVGSVLNVLQTAVKSVNQLCLQDHMNKRQCLLYRLSEDKTFRNFKSVTIFGSRQDSYSHFESSIACLPLKAKDYSRIPSENKAIYREILRNFESNCQNLRRYELVFQEFQDDKFGRSAHIAMIEDCFFLEIAVFISNFHK
jgi:hypothetical protein